ncbi:CotH kinase family protein [Sanyastnella coralliicola]|uniref:CotH kinase family protein n=1 Tax=Sanyastnella coralliicola TaxID=3069118 RepID=UPI0027B88C72|nr:CotH kinase family protein [Longitalea sp. SCSIO 12813]
MRILFLILILLPAIAESQWSVDYNSGVYLPDEIATIRIEIDQDSLDLIFFEDSLYSNHEYPATFIFESQNLVDTVENIGFRLRGNTSREADKKSFKVSFNTFQQGNDWFGFEKLNLNGEHNDPSIMRSRLCWEMAHQFGINATMATHVRLYINGEYRGLYLNVEHIDDTHVERQFGSDAGDLYKCHWSGNLSWQGGDEDTYKNAPWGTRIYELKTNKAYDDYSDFVHFLDVLNNTGINDLQCELEKVFDVHDYLKAAAFEIMIGHWDGYIWNNNNYYLYQRPDDLRFQFLEYDLDNTLGIDWVGIDWADRNIYDYENNDRPLYERLLQIPEYRDAFTHHIESFIAMFSQEALEMRVAELYDLMEDAALEDEYKGFDYGFTDEDFLLASAEAWGGHVDQGILDYFADRVESAQEMLEEYTLPMAIQVSDNSPFLEPILSWEVNTPFGADDVYAEIIVDGIVTASISLTETFENEWQASTPVSTSLDGLHYQIKYSRDGIESSAFCEPKWIWISPVETGLVLNELMSTNSSNIADNAGDYDDWFELYNMNPTGIALADYWITDNLTYPAKYRYREGNISGTGHRLFWADKEDEEGLDHANFRLSGSGESLTIVTEDQGALRIVDNISFGEIPTNFSLGRSTDGAPDWIVFDQPTPNASNGVVHVHENTSYGPSIYPNPTTGVLFVTSTEEIKVYNIEGRLLETFQSTKQIDLSHYPAGCYLIALGNRKVRILKQ